MESSTLLQKFSVELALNEKLGVTKFRCVQVMQVSLLYTTTADVLLTQ